MEKDILSATGAYQDVADQIGRFQVELTRMQDGLSLLKNTVEKIIEDVNTSREGDDTLAGSEQQDSSQAQVPGKSLKTLQNIIKAKNINGLVREDGKVILHKDFRRVKQEDIELDPKVKELGAVAIKSASSKDYGENSYLHQGKPNADQMALIKVYMDKSVTAADVICQAYEASNTEIDRGGEAFEPPALDTFQKQYPGKPLLLDHEWNTKNRAGTVFYAVHSGQQLLTTVAIPTFMTDVVKMCQMGMMDHVSVGFAIAPEMYICSACGKSMMTTDCPHYPGEKGDDGKTIYARLMDIIEVYELSIVVIPMNQYADQLKDTGAAYVKSLNDMTSLRLQALKIANDISSNDGISEGCRTELLTQLEEIMSTDRMSTDMTMKDSSVMADNQAPVTDPKADPTSAEVPPITVPEATAPSTEAPPAEVKTEPAQPETPAKPEVELTDVQKAELEAQQKANKKIAKMAKKLAKQIVKNEAFKPAVDLTEVNKTVDGLKGLLTNVEPILKAHAELDGRMKELDGKIEKLTMLLALAKNIDVDALNDLVEGNDQVQEDNWVRSTFASDYAGGQ